MCADPIKYTRVPASLKIIKVLIDELKSAAPVDGSLGEALAAAKAVNKDDDDDNDDDDDDDAENDDWEDVEDMIDVSLGTTKQDILAYLKTGSSSRQRDQETYSFLCEFFLRAARDNVAGFQGLTNLLTRGELDTLNKELASAPR